MNGWNDRRIKFWTAATLSIGLPFAIILIYWPGFLDGDSLAMLWFAQRGWTQDFHSPLLTLIWSWLLPLGRNSHTGSILIAQITLVVLALNALLRSFGIRGWSLVVFTVLLTWFPTVSGYAGTLVKDVWMGSSLVCAYVIGYCARTGKGSAKAILWTAAIFIGALTTQFRGNALPAVVPLLFFPFTWNSIHWLTRTGCFVASIFALFLMTLLLQAWVGVVMKVEHTFPQQSIFLKDLARISIRDEEQIIPPAFNRMELTLEELEAIWKLESCNTLFQFNRPKKRALNFSRSREEIAGLRSLWLQKISEAPLDHFSYRIRFGWVFFFSHGNAPWLQWIYHHGKVPETQIVQTSYTPRAYKVSYFQFADFIEESALARGYPYLLMLSMACGLQVTRWRSPHRSLILLLSSGILLYYAIFAAVSPHFGFRYLWLLCFSAPALLCGSLLSAGSSRKISD